VIEHREEVDPPWCFRLPLGSGLDGLTRTRGTVVHRLVAGENAEPVHVRVAQTSGGVVVLGGRARTRASARAALGRMRFALGVDEDLRPFHERFRDDPLIGRHLRNRRAFRPWRHPDPFLALAWAIIEQKIEFVRAVDIQRRIVFRLGRRDADTGLWWPPDAAALARVSPAWLQGMDLDFARAATLVRAAREVAAGRIDLDPAADHEAAWRRLRAIRGIGAWTVEMTALTGQGRNDQLPAADVGFLKLVGRLKTGNPKARATEQEVRDFFAPYAPWTALAALLARGPVRLGLRSPGLRPRQAAAA
jgi:3-methyladenine DNA glycosylase/8-oxoguanine DNA glycosylase